MSTTSIVTIFAICVSILLVIFRWNKGNSDTETKLLKLPLIGDLHSSPLDKPLLNWDSWARDNGPVAIPKLFGIIPVVVLNSYDAVTELFSRRSQWYSNRPASVSMEMITDDKSGQSKFTLMHDYDEHLKLHHRILAPSLGALGSPRYRPLIVLESKQLLVDLLNAVRTSPGEISTHSIFPLLERTQASIILALHYGLRIADCEQKILHDVIDIQTQITHVAATPAMPDFIPLLRHLPAFFSPWKRAADKLYAAQVDLYLRLFNHGRQSPGWNATKQAISTAEKSGIDKVPDLDIAFNMATSVQGGMETFPRQILWLFIAALHRPSFVTRAHALLDEVVGRDRMPLFSDRAGLKFIDAIASEILRWRPIAPGAIPRRADRDDEIDCIKIKEGVTIMANAWGIGRDAKVFDPALGDLDDFVPERWLRVVDGGEEKLMTELPLPVFGQGRRMCQGKRVATDGLYMQIASILWAFDIEAADGEEVDPWEMVVAGFMTMPREVKFRLRPRGDWATRVIERDGKDVGKALDAFLGVVDQGEK
ncbi:unnamed protein product [Penicillium olsonii]|uniref:Cytochrome P450 n=1 Tax=Penicillium olsonii TaxID=99116 RepID=A0A9W4MVH2_PENOL|nr:unnamed protein product [Penicillium olsonii]CAG8104899.1 unnamed protein product [Penicillium olsonii]